LIQEQKYLIDRRRFMMGEEFKPSLKIPLLEEVENRLNELIRQKKEAIERELEEKIRREKEEAEKKIKQIEEEFERGKKLLEDYHQVVADFEAERMRLQQEIKERFQRVIQHQTEIEKLASLTLEEIKQVAELNSQLETLEKRSGEKIALIRQQIEEKYGLVTGIPEIVAEEEFKVDLEKELERLKKIKELLEERVSGELPEWPELKVKEEKVSEPAPVIEEKAEEKPAESREIFAGPELEVRPPEREPEITPPAEIAETFTFEPDLSIKAPAAETPAEEMVETFQDIYERLEGYRRVHSENEGEVSYFEKGETRIIDAEALIATMNETLEASKRLYQKLAQTDSPKDHFFIKQEIINQQEILRKHLLHVIKLCEKEGFILPAVTQNVVNTSLLKDLLERLSIENWSDEIDFQAISEFIEALKENFYRLITPPVSYLRALLVELGAL
jgi:hypothetical protein